MDTELLLKQRKWEDRILDLIDHRDDFTRSDLQSAVGAIVVQLVTDSPMTNKPLTLTRKEMREIAEIEVVRQMWGAEDAADMETILDQRAYAVKFNFHSGGPGYVGDYFILAGDALAELVQLIRRNGRIVLL